MADANAKGSEGFEAGPRFDVNVPIFHRNDGQVARASAELWGSSP